MVQATEKPMSNEALVEAKYDRQPIKLPMSALQEYWELGFINSAAYAFLALRVDQIGVNGESEDFDIQQFIDDWAVPGEDGKKDKRLSEKDVMAVLNKLRANGYAEYKMTMQLRLL